MAKEAKVRKDSKTKERLAYVTLGMCIDYFIFKPIRKLNFALFIGIGFVSGILFEIGLERLVDYVKAAIN